MENGNINHNIDDIISSYLSGNITANDEKMLKQWIDESPENKHYFLQQQEIWTSYINEKEKNLYDKDKAYDRFQMRVNEATEDSHKRLYHIPKIWRYAAVIAVMIGITYFAYDQGSEKVKRAFADIQVEAPMGSHTKLYLPDGTMVWLNAGSKMVYSQGFGVDDRRVTLEGEAYFEVKHEEDLPFTVESKNLKVKVLGTKFNFQDYKDDSEAIVTLNKGRIQLSNLLNKEDDIILSPDQRIVLDKSNGSMKKENTTAANAKDWVEGNLFFDEILLGDIVKRLERSYNVDIIIRNVELRNYRFYGNFTKREQNIKDVMDALSETGRIHYTMKNRTIIIY